MSADTIHIIVTVGIIALMFAWVPLVNVVLPPGFRSKEELGKKDCETGRPRPPFQEKPSPAKNPPRLAPVSSLPSRRLANQSHNLLNAISARGHSEPAALRVPRASMEKSLSQKEIIKTCAE